MIRLKIVLAHCENKHNNARYVHSSIFSTSIYIVLTYECNFANYFDFFQFFERDLFQTN